MFLVPYKWSNNVFLLCKLHQQSHPMGVISAKQMLQTLLTQSCALQIFEHLEALQATGAPGAQCPRLTKGGTNGHVDASEVLVGVKRREVLPLTKLRSQMDSKF